MASLLCALDLAVLGRHWERIKLARLLLSGNDELGVLPTPCQSEGKSFHHLKSRTQEDLEKNVFPQKLFTETPSGMKIGMVTGMCPSFSDTMSGEQRAACAAASAMEEREPGHLPFILSSLCLTLIIRDWPGL